MLDEVVDSYHAGSLSREEVVETVLESYDHGTIEELVREWASLDWFTARMPAIQEGIDSFLDGRYFAAVCTLLPHVEGVLGEELRRKPNPQNDAGKFFSDTPLSETAKEFYIKVARADFWFDPGKPVPEMSRNAILHGRDVSYGTKGHALRTILVLDAVIGAVDEHRKDREESERWAEWRKAHGFEEMGE
jgi:hypothetical protein